MTRSRQRRYLPESDQHTIEQRNDPRPATRANSLLRQARKARLWSQGELAEHIGVAKETISRWENGVSRPQPQLLRQLCEVFQTTPEALGYALNHEEGASPPCEDSSRSLFNAPSAIASSEPVSAQGESRASNNPHRRRFLIELGGLGAAALAG